MHDRLIKTTLKRRFFMRKMKKLLGMIALALTLSATPVLAEPNNDIVLYGPVGQCDVCGYAYATTVYTYGEWYVMYYYQHAGHTDEHQGRAKYANVSCPNCGSVKRYYVGVDERNYCRYGTNG